ncbi:MAG: ABC transporter permease [Bacteroidales bacterium]|nr:ABC transporter permease [Bacteroidales bacterium]
MIRDIVYKDLLQAFKDRKGLALSFLLPIVLITLFSLVYGGISTGIEDKPQKIIFCDLDSSLMSRKLQAELQNSKGLSLLFRQKEAGKKLILDGDIASMLLVNKGFSDSLKTGGAAPIEFFYDESKEMEMGLIKGALMSVLMPFLGEQGSKGQIHQFIDDKYAYDLPAEMINEIHADIDSQYSSDEAGNNTANSTTVKSTPLSVKEKMPWGLIQAFAGTSVMMLLFSIVAMGASIIKEQENGTLKRLLYSPIRPWQIMISKLLSGFIFALIQMTILLIFVYLAFGLNIFQNFFTLILLVISTSFAVSGFGILIAAISKSQKQVESLSLIIILVMSALGGSMIPLFIFPELLKTIALFTLNYWAIDGFYDNLGRDVGLLVQLKNIGVLLLFGAISSLMAIYIFTKRLQKDF